MSEMSMTFTNYREVKTQIHSQILAEVDLESLDKLQEDVARKRVGEAIRELLNRDRTPLTLKERDQLIHEILDELFGLGPIEPLLEDATVSDILINGPDNIFVERAGMLERTD